MICFVNMLYDHLISRNSFPVRCQVWARYAWQRHQYQDQKSKIVFQFLASGDAFDTKVTIFNRPPVKSDICSNDLSHYLSQQIQPLTIHTAWANHLFTPMIPNLFFPRQKKSKNPTKLRRRQHYHSVTTSEPASAPLPWAVASLLPVSSSSSSSYYFFSSYSSYFSSSCSSFFFSSCSSSSSFFLFLLLLGPVLLVGCSCLERKRKLWEWEWDWEREWEWWEWCPPTSPSTLGTSTTGKKERAPSWDRKTNRMLPRMIERDCWRQRQSFFCSRQKRNHFMDWRLNNHIVMGPKCQEVLAAMIEMAAIDSGNDFWEETLSLRLID